MKHNFMYLCSNLGHILGLDIRIYQNGKLIEAYRNTGFEPDPICLVYDRFSKFFEQPVSYVMTEDFLLFGSVRTKKNDTLMLIGPTFRILPDKARANLILHKLGEPYTKLSGICSYFESIVAYQLENFLQVLCFINYILNGSQLNSIDLIGQEVAGNKLPSNPPMQVQRVDEITVHNTFPMEKELLSYISTGQPEALRMMFEKPPTGEAGRWANEETRQQKNILIAAAVLASRAAIDGGLSREIAMTFCDSYIQKAELMSDYHLIAILNMQMLLDFAERVKQLQCPDLKSELIRNAVQHINANLNRKLTTASIAIELKVSRTYLCKSFAKEIGQTINGYIMQQKIWEAKRMLETTNLPVVNISESLAFSSQSYFQNIFKKMTGKTPKEFRMNLQ